MYFVVIALFMLILPVASIAAEYSWLHTNTDLVALTGKWFAFWGVGMRLGLAGVRQAFNPAFTARDIFEIEDERVHPIARELGFANLALGLLGLLALLPGWATPAALAGGLEACDRRRTQPHAHCRNGVGLVYRAGLDRLCGADRDARALISAARPPLSRSR